MFNWSVLNVEFYDASQLSIGNFEYSTLLTSERFTRMLRVAYFNRAKPVQSG